MRSLLTLGLLFAGFGFALADDKKDPTAGKWVIESVTREGKPHGGWAGATRDHTDGKYTMKPVNPKATPTTGTYKIDTTKVPMTIDMMPTGGTYDGKTLLGIVKLDGQTLTIAFAEPGKDRPTAFESKEGSGIIIAIQKKAK